MTLLREPIRHPLGHQYEDLVCLEDVAWKTYEMLLRDTAAQRLRITYDQGRMSIMSPLPWHEQVKEWIGQLIEAATLEMKIPRRSLGSTTWRREDLSRGLEPDRCYFIQNEARVRGRRHFDLRRDPPPDLAVEVQITHHPIDRLKIYAALGVGEIWRFDGERVHFLVLRKNGRYTQSTRSVALPFLSSADVNRYIEMFETTDENSVIAAFREWLQEQR